MAGEERKLSGWDKLMMAITFAEVGEHDTARSILDPTTEIEQRQEKRTRKRSEQRPQMRV